MADDINFVRQLQIERRLQIFKGNGRRPQLFRQKEDDLNLLSQWKTTSII
jgi:hypothetical protein